MARLPDALLLLVVPPVHQVRVRRRPKVDRPQVAVVRRRLLEALHSRAQLRVTVAWLVPFQRRQPFLLVRVLLVDLVVPPRRLLPPHVDCLP